LTDLGYKNPLKEDKLLVKKLRSEIYLECFYQKGMTITEIATSNGVTEAAVRKAVAKFDPETYQLEQQRRSEERKESRRKKDRISKQITRRKRNQKYIEEERAAYEWLLERWKRIFPATKKKGISDADLVWFACAQSGIQNVLDSPDSTKDIKKLIRSAYRKTPEKIEVIDQDYVTPMGCSKSGKGGGKSDRTARIALLG
jgi:transposase